MLSTGGGSSMNGPTDQTDNLHLFSLPSSIVHALASCFPTHRGATTLRRVDRNLSGPASGIASRVQSGPGSKHVKHAAISGLRF